MEHDCSWKRKVKIIVPVNKGEGHKKFRKKCASIDDYTVGLYLSKLGEYIVVLGYLPFNLINQLLINRLVLF